MSNLRFAIDFARHRLKAKTRHGTHSPFVYKLVDEVIYDFSKKKVYAEVETQLKALHSDKRMINARLAQLIYRLVADLKPVNMLVSGEGLDVLSAYLEKAAPDVELYHVKDGTLPATLDKVDFAFIDTDTKEDTLRYFEALLPKTHNGTLLIFNNVYGNKDMKEAWATIKARPQVTVTINLFWMGLLYFRKGQVKEDFSIKF